MAFLVFPGGRGERFDLPPRLVRAMRVGFWLSTVVGLAAAIVLVISSYQCGSEFNYSGCSYIPVFWFIQAILLGLALIFLGILYYGRTAKALDAQR